MTKCPKLDNSSKLVNSKRIERWGYILYLFPQTRRSLGLESTSFGRGFQQKTTILILYVPNLYKVRARGDTIQG